MKAMIIVGSALFLGACKNADIAQLESLGSKHKITCYSGDRVIYEGESNGNISNEQKSDGWYWQDSVTHKLVEATGPCIILQE